MPVFDYECVKCGFRESDVLIRGDARRECPYCLSPMRKKLGAPAPVFRGDGWTGKFYAKGGKND